MDSERFVVILFEKSQIPGFRNKISYLLVSPYTHIPLVADSFHTMLSVNFVRVPTPGEKL